MKDAGKYDYGRLMKDAERLKNQYELTSGSAGRSARGRELLWLMAGRGEKILLMLGTHHGREHITSRYLMDVFEEFLKNAPPELTEKNKFVILPMVNPCGKREPPSLSTEKPPVQYQSCWNPTFSRSISGKSPTLTDSSRQPPSPAPAWWRSPSGRIPPPMSKPVWKPC